MLIQILLFLLIGIISGIFTGLIPGIHINLLGVFLIALASKFVSINPIYFVVLITAMAITHTFLDFIPSIFLGCPDTDTELSVLPGHELLKKGEGYQAILLTAYGSIAAVFILILIALPLSFFLPALSFIFFLPSLILTKYILAMVKFFASWPHSFLTINYLWPGWLVLYYVLVIFIIIKARRSKLLKEELSDKI